jgi:hypothetical protein
MRYKAENVKYWQQGDNKCQFGMIGFTSIIINRLFAYTYVIDGLAQKLQYFCSPVKNTYW